MNYQQKELSKFVLEDLELLFEDFGGTTFQDKRIRNASAILNKLFNEDNLMRAWRFNVGSMTVPMLIAPRLEYFIEADTYKQITHAIAGGATLEGAEYALAIVNTGQTGISVQPSIDPISHKYKIKEYFESVGLILFGEQISRFNLIKYVANKAGGKHIDFTRTSKLEKEKYEKIDQGIDVFNIFGKNAVNVELHAIIQNVHKSDDIQYLMTRIRNNI